MTRLLRKTIPGSHLSPAPNLAMNNAAQVAPTPGDSAPTFTAPQITPASPGGYPSTIAPPTAPIFPVASNSSVYPSGGIVALLFPREHRFKFLRILLRLRIREWMRALPRFSRGAVIRFPVFRTAAFNFPSNPGQRGRMGHSFQVGIITISDRASNGEYEDFGGTCVAFCL